MSGDGRSARDERDVARRHVHEFRVRFGDLDPFGHVNNVRALGHLEDARVSFLHWDGGDGEFPGLVVSRHEVDYLLPMTLRREPYRVETWIRELGAASFTIDYELRDDDHVYLRASSVIVGYDVRGRRPRRFTPAERAFLEAHVVPPR